MAELLSSIPQGVLGRGVQQPPAARNNAGGNDTEETMEDLAIKFVVYYCFFQSAERTAACLPRLFEAYLAGKRASFADIVYTVLGLTGLSLFGGLLLS